MSNTRRRKDGCVVTILIVATVVALVPIQTTIWDGGFQSAEYRFIFINAEGQPVPGVTLTVRTQAGGVCHLYPVDDFLPEQIPTSDTEGRLVFHHVGKGPEFSGRVHANFVRMSYGETKCPQYDCVFSLAGREIHRVRFDTLHRYEDQLARVTRTWHMSDWPQREYDLHDDWNARVLQLFDGNGDGRLDREEGIAARYFEWAPEQYHFESNRKKDVIFDVVERTVTVK